MANPQFLGYVSNFKRQVRVLMIFHGQIFHIHKKHTISRTPFVVHPLQVFRRNSAETETTLDFTKIRNKLQVLYFPRIIVRTKHSLSNHISASSLMHV